MISLSLDEPQVATASIVRNWILLESPGPWGFEARTENRLGPGLAPTIAARARDARARLILLRRPGGAGEPGHHCFTVRTHPTGSWMEHARLPDPSALLDVDLSPLATGRPTGLGPLETAPLYLVCTNGRRDPCCAELGRPIAHALAASFGERLWECSHIGGDRFAANLVCFPHGLYFGRLDPAAAVEAARRYAEGTIDLDHFRGRASYDWPTQAAEAFVRRERNLRGIDDLRLVRRRTDADGLVEVEFVSPAGSTITVRVEVGRADRARPLTCHAIEESQPPAYRHAG